MDDLAANEKGNTKAGGRYWEGSVVIKGRQNNKTRDSASAAPGSLAREEREKIRRCGREKTKRS